jgi:hypothetical protein
MDRPVRILERIGDVADAQLGGTTTHVRQDVGSQPFIDGQY